MSQTSETSEITGVRSVQSNRESAGVAIAAVLAALGRGALTVAQVGAKVAVGATRLAWRGAVKAVDAMAASDTTTYDLRPLPASLRAEVMRASSLNVAITALANAGTRLANAAAVEPLLEKIGSALSLGDEKAAKESLSALADEAGSQHQALLAGCVLSHAEAVVRERGFTKLKIVPERGYLLAERANGEEVRMDVIRSSDGRGVRYAVDANKFDGEKCVEEVAAIHAAMDRRGVAGKIIRSVRKSRVPVGRKAARVGQHA